MYGSTAPPTAAQVVAAARLIQATDTSLKRYANVQAAFAAGYTYPGGVFSDDLSAAATSSAVQAVLAQHS